VCRGRLVLEPARRGHEEVGLKPERFLNDWPSLP
jgi:hypothetical protein